MVNWEGRRCEPGFSNALNSLFFCSLWKFHTRHVFFINFTILFKSYYKWKKISSQSDREDGVRACEKHLKMIKHCPNTPVYLCPSFCQKSWKRAYRDAWNTRVTKVKSESKKRKKNKSGGLQWGWNEAGQKHTLTASAPGYLCTWLPGYPAGASDWDLGLPTASCTDVSSSWGPPEPTTSPSYFPSSSLNFHHLHPPDWSPHTLLILAFGFCSCCSLSVLTCAPTCLICPTWIPLAQGAAPSHHASSSLALGGLVPPKSLFIAIPPYWVVFNYTVMCVLPTRMNVFWAPAVYQA